MTKPSISFIRKPAKHTVIKHKDGSEERTYIFTIPQNYIRMGYIDPKQKYRITIEKFFNEEQKLLKLINGLDDRLALGQINQETYYKLIEKYNKKIEDLKS